MLDRTIPFYNTILRCVSYRDKNVVLPEGFSIVSYKNGYEKSWAELEYSVGDFNSLEDAENYFVETYLQKRELQSNILFLLNSDNAVIGSCIAWQDKRGDDFVSSLHWLVVDEKYHGMGLGRALCCATMKIFEEQANFPSISIRNHGVGKLFSYIFPWVSNFKKTIPSHIMKMSIIKQWRN